MVVTSRPEQRWRGCFRHGGRKILQQEDPRRRIILAPYAFWIHFKCTEVVLVHSARIFLRGRNLKILAPCKLPSVVMLYYIVVVIFWGPCAGTYLCFADLLPFSHCLPFRGRFTKSQEDPKRRNNLFVVFTITKMPIRSFRSLSWTSVKNYLSVELSQLSACGNAKQNARSYCDLQSYCTRNLNTRVTN